MVDMNLEQARHNMIAQQIRPWDVLDERVLETIMRVPRESFVPEAYRALAFADLEIPLAHDQAMMAPKIEARMLQALRLKPEDTALEIGTGSGYVTALLGHLVKQVCSVDIYPEFADAAAARLQRHGIGNVTVDTGDAAQGWSQRGSFDVIAVTGALPVVPDELRQQLNMGGRLFVVSGDAPAMEARLIVRAAEDEWHTETLFETELKPLVNAPRSSRFVL